MTARSTAVSAAVAILLVAPLCGAQVLITSRESFVREAAEYPEWVPPEYMSFDHQYTFDQPGDWTMLGQRTWAGPEGIGAVIGGSTWNTLDAQHFYHSGSMHVRFTVTQPGLWGVMNFSGETHPGSEFLFGNASLSVVNTDSGELVFDIYRDGTRYFDRVGSMNLTGFWDPQTRTFELPIGNYEFFTQTSGTDVVGEGSGVGSRGWADLYANLTFVPAPGAAALSALWLLTAARRRR